MTNDGTNSIFVPLVENGPNQTSYSKLDAYFGAAGMLVAAAATASIAPMSEPAVVSAGIANTVGQMTSQIPSTVGWYVDNLSTMVQNVGIAIDAIDHGALSPVDSFDGD